MSNVKRKDALFFAHVRKLEDLAAERNMVSDLIMSDGGEWMLCVLGTHDAHSFWAAVRKAHAALKKVAK